MSALRPFNQPGSKKIESEGLYLTCHLTPDFHLHEEPLHALTWIQQGKMSLHRQYTGLSAAWLLTVVLVMYHIG